MPFGSRDPKVDLLSRLELFQSCNRRQLREVSGLCDNWEFPEGTVLARQGRQTRQCFVIVAGVASAAIDGHVIGTVVTGTFVGHRTVLHHEPINATVTTISAVQVLLFPAREFLSLAVGDPVIATTFREQIQLPDPLVHPAIGGKVLVPA
jgi:CRP-like cAMP-binding protein